MKLTAAKRKKIPRSKFGLESAEKYPMPDRAHAANAKARASAQFNLGKLSKAQVEEIDNKADKILGEKENEKE